jgi:hypothetical protein
MKPSSLVSVMAGLDPAIQLGRIGKKRVSVGRMNEKAQRASTAIGDRVAWMAGSSPAMTWTSARAGAIGTTMENGHGA